MTAFKRYVVYVAILASSIAVTAYGQSNTTEKVPTKVNRQLPEEGPYCVSIDVPSVEKAEELRSLGIKCKEPGTIVLWISERLLNELKERGFNTRIMDLELVKEVSLGEDIWDIYLGPKGKASAARPLLVKSRKEVVGEESVSKILFLNSNGIPVTEKPYNDIVTVSRHAERVGFFWPSENFKEKRSGRWEFFSGSGQKTGELSIPVIWEGDMTWIELSDVGNFARVVMSDKLWLSFYGKGAELMKRVMARDENLFEISVDVDLSEDGRYLVLQVVRHRPKPNDLAGGNVVILYKSDGSEVWRFTLGEQLDRSSSVSTSRDGSYVISSLKKSNKEGIGPPMSLTYLLDKRGGVIRTIRDFPTIRAKFSRSGKYVALFNKSGIMLLETPGGDILFDYRTKSPLRDFDLAEDGRLVGAVEHESVVLLDFDGKRLWHRRFPDVTSTPFPKISLSEDGQEFSLATGNKFYVYRRVQFE